MHGHEESSVWVTVHSSLGSSLQHHFMEAVIDAIANGTSPWAPTTAPTVSPTAAPHVTQIAPYNIANYVTSALYIGLILWAVFNLYTHMSSRLLIDAPKMLFGHVIAWALGM